MLTRTGNATNAIAALAATTAPRRNLVAGMPRRPSRTEMTIATNVPRICNRPELVNGSGIGRRLAPSLNMKARTNTTR